MKMRWLWAKLAAGLLVVASPAYAGDDHDPFTNASVRDGGSAALRPCIETAIAMRPNAWVCTGYGLTIVDEGGTATFTSISPAVPETTEDLRGASILSDDYDTWCETGSICHRKINSYAEETKGNAAYGDSSGLIGTYDAIIRTNLNGRQGQWKVTLIWDGGPALNFYDVYIHCKEEISNFPDSNCGDHYAGAPRIGSFLWRWDSGTLYGNRLANSNEYYANLNLIFDPDGPYTAHSAGTLSTSQFNCYGTSNCVFP
ncbi:hypothetical protein AB0H43_14040 [Hamadaea sp. NPDC050747]|uniref:hypothetical protein n=1 Tax=Hamadaea sp. NPDC050747 TaxID=3155789 RepID=UPI0033EDF375